MKKSERIIVYQFCEISGTALIIACNVLLLGSVIIQQISGYEFLFPPVFYSLCALILFITAFKMTQNVFAFNNHLLIGLILLAVLLLLLSTFFSINPSLSFKGLSNRYEGFMTWCGYLTLLLGSLSICEEKHRRWICISILVMGCVNVVYTFLQYMELFPKLTHYSSLYRKYKLVPGLCGNAVFLAAYMVSFSAAAMGLFVKAKHWRQQIAALLCLLMAAAVIVMSKSSAGILGLGIVLLLGAVYIYTHRMDLKRWRCDAYPLMITLMIASVIVLCLLLLFHNAWLLRFQHEVEDAIEPLLSGVITEQSGSGRYMVWKNAITLIPDHLLLGSGPDTFGLLYHSVFPLNNGQYFDKAHNEYLEVLLTMGLSMLISLLCIYGTVIKGIFKRLWSKQGTMVSAACVFGVCGYLIQAFFGITSILSTHLFWILLGLGAGQLWNESRVVCDE